MELDDIEDVYMIGYPGVARLKGSQDPISRKGITATSFNSEYGDIEGSGLLDMGSAPGSSGSPIILADKLRWVNKQLVRLANGDGQVQLQGGYVRLLGVLSSGPLSTIPVQNESAQETMLKADVTPFNHLGIYVKSYRVLEILNLANNPNPTKADTKYEVVNGHDGHPTCEVHEPY